MRPARFMHKLHACVCGSMCNCQTVRTFHRLYQLVWVPLAPRPCSCPAPPCSVSCCLHGWRSLSCGPCCCRQQGHQPAARARCGVKHGWSWPWHCFCSHLLCRISGLTFSTEHEPATYVDAMIDAMHSCCHVSVRQSASANPACA